MDGSAAMLSDFRQSSDLLLSDSDAVMTKKKLDLKAFATVLLQLFTGRSDATHRYSIVQSLITDH